MKHKIFIDGSEGTTGLKIYERFAGRDDIEVLAIAPAKRKDADERRRLINASDVTFLCLPDEAARESVSLVENEKTVVIDASTAHRVADGWSYGFPELSAAHRQNIATGRRISVPGCHATGFIALIFPLVKAGLLAADYPFAVTSISGYSGGGKKVIAEYEDEGRDACYDAPRLYALGQRHKHLPEMTKVCALAREPLFSPVIADYYAGMVVSVPIYGTGLAATGGLRALHDFYMDYYAGAGLVKVAPLPDDSNAPAFLGGNEMAGRDDLYIYLTGHDERIVLCAAFDNLGKGASGAAVQCMNIALGCEEAVGLVVG